jgi:hypothetical protein
MAVTTYTHGGTGSQPFGSNGSGIKMIDGFATSAFASSGPTDPYTGVQLYLVNQMVMVVGGTAASASMGLWNSAGVQYQYVTQTINNVAASVSSTTATETATLNAVIQSGKTYYAGIWASASLATKRDTATGSFSSYTGSRTSTTVGTTYNPGNLYFQIKYYQLPNAPTSLTVTGTTGTTASLSWTAPTVNTQDGGTPITAYKIQYSTNGGSSWITYSEGTYGVTTTTATLTGLTPGQTYQFRVAAKNGVVPGYGFNGTGGMGSTYSDASATWTYDGYSSGPYSTATSSVQLPGGMWSGVIGWVPISAKVCIYPKTVKTGVAWTASPFSSPITITLGAGHGLLTGDLVNMYSVTGWTGISSTNLAVIGASSTTIDLDITNNSSSSSGTFNATIVGYRPAHVKRNNGVTGWDTII